MQAAIPLGGGDVLGLDVGAGELHGGDRHLPPRGRGHPRLRSRRARSHFTDPPPRLAPSAAWTAAAAAARRLKQRENGQHLRRKKEAASGPT